MFTRRIIVLSAVAVAATGATGNAEAFRSFHVGNSLSGQTVGIEGMATTLSFDHSWGIHLRCGSQINVTVTNPTDTCIDPHPEFGYFGNALPNYTWDAVTLQPYGDPMPAGRAAVNTLIDLTRQRPENANTTFYIMSMWPQGESPDSYAARWKRGYNETTDDYESRWSQQYADQFLKHVRSDQPGLKLGIVPCGEILYQFDLYAKAGLISGYSSASQLYGDPYHLTPTGAYLAKMTHFATMFGNTPAGLPIPADVTLSADDALELQRMIWRIVTTMSSDTLVLASDGDRDGVVTFLDAQSIADHFGKNTYLVREGDFNGSGWVNSYDFNLLASQFGQSVAAVPAFGSVVPEPVGLMGLVLAGGMLLRRRV